LIKNIIIPFKIKAVHIDAKEDFRLESFELLVITPDEILAKVVVDSILHVIAHESYVEKRHVGWAQINKRIV
jgi:riboflavin transporter FmnP